MSKFNDFAVVVWDGVITQWEYIKDIVDSVDDCRHANHFEVREYYVTKMR